MSVRKREASSGDDAKSEGAVRSRAVVAEQRIDVHRVSRKGEAVSGTEKRQQGALWYCSANGKA